jgi:GntR family transcriptional repressor for pyruvate dehydrogenase complex
MAAQQILDQIHNGELAPGCRLPAQRRLARRLGVGRSSLREALNALVVMGYLRAVQGSGTFVRRELPNPSPGGEGLARALEAGSIFHLMEARELLECRSAALAAERAGRQKILKLQGIVRRLASMPPVPYEDFLKVDFEFHLCVARATGNEVICEMTRLVLEKVAEHHSRLRTERLSEAYRSASVRTAGEVASAVAAGDAAKAASRMHRHLHLIRDELREVVG